MKNPKVVVILGRPGSGKGTQAKLLLNKFHLEYFGSGDSLRKRQQLKDFTGKKITLTMKEGKLVPSFIISKIWMDELEKLKRKSKFRGLLFDGSPRKIIEAQYFDEALNWYEWQKNTKVILIDISEKNSFHRLTKRRICQKCKRIIPYIGAFKNLKQCDKCGGALVTRADDKPSAIKKRLEEFKKEVMQVVNHYSRQGKLVKINGEQSIEDVFKDILKVLK